MTFLSYVSNYWATWNCVTSPKAEIFINTTTRTSKSCKSRFYWAGLHKHGRFLVLAVLYRRKLMYKIHVWSNRAQCKMLSYKGRCSKIKFWIRKWSSFF